MDLCQVQRLEKKDGQTKKAQQQHRDGQQVRQHRQVLEAEEQGKDKTTIKLLEIGAFFLYP